MPRPSTARQRILDTAQTLFYRDGYRATGIDRIIADSSVAKMTFYRHFPAKAQLITTVLDLRHQHWMAWFEQRLAKRKAPERGLGVIAQVLGEWFKTPDFRGCAFINALAEDGVQHELIEPVRAHKQALRTCVRNLAAQRGLRPADAAADAIMVVIEGSIVRTQTTADVATTVNASRRLLAALESAMQPNAQACVAR